MRDVAEPAPGEERHPALALVNTTYLSQGAVRDELADPAGAGRWLRAAVDPAFSGPDAAGAAALRTLRESVRALLDAHLRGGAPDPQAVRAVNDVLLDAPAVPLLSWSAGEVPRVRRTVPHAGPLAAALGAIAEDVVGLLTGPDATRLAACGAPGCVRLLLRTHGRRHWCSTRCGDRVRAARHYARTRTPS